MLTLTKKELTVLDEAQPDYTVHLIETELEGSRWWKMEVRLPAQKKVYEAITAQGKTKVWKNLDVAVDYIKDSCPRARDVLVSFEPVPRADKRAAASQH